MKTIIFSDTHLSHRADPRKLALLLRVLSTADRVIINGDFWDRYLCTFDQFLSSSWQQLFPVLKKRKAIYLVGNHDLRTYFDDRWRLFADKVADKLELKIGKNRFHIEHGHLQAYSFGMYYPRLSNIFGMLYPYLDRIEHGGHLFTSLYRAYLAKQHDDAELLSYAKAHKKKNKWFVFGHSHVQRKSVAEGYLNPGSFRCGVGNWLTIVSSGTVTLHSEAYNG